MGATPLRTLTRVVGALEGSIDISVRWQGEELERLMDAGHAYLVERAVAALAAEGWETRIELSFNYYGDRGRVDVLAFHAPSRTTIVVEVKSVIVDIQEMLGRLDVKVRLGRQLASSAGWDVPRRVVPALVVGDSRRARRVVAEHQAVLARFDLRGRQAAAWLRAPERTASTGLLWFVSVPSSRSASITRFSRVRSARKGS